MALLTTMVGAYLLNCNLLERCNKLDETGDMERTTPAQGVTFASIYRRKKAMLTLGQAALEDAWEYMAPRVCVAYPR